MNVTITVKRRRRIWTETDEVRPLVDGEWGIGVFGGISIERCTPGWGMAPYHVVHCEEREVEEQVTVKVPEWIAKLSLIYSPAIAAGYFNEHPEHLEAAIAAAKEER